LVLAKPLIYVFPNKFKLNQTNETPCAEHTFRGGNSSL